MIELPYKSDASTTLATVQRGYETNRDLITSGQAGKRDNTEFRHAWVIGDA